MQKHLNDVVRQPLLRIVALLYVLNVEHVMGIKGRGDGRKMFESGEATIDYQTSSSFLKGVQPLVDEGKAVPMMTWGALNASGQI